MLKKNGGITLIALVVTIIVLLILAGISIAMLTADNGIITRTNYSKMSQIEGQVVEEIKLAVQSAKIDATQKSVATSTGYLASAHLNDVEAVLREDLPEDSPKVNYAFDYAIDPNDESIKYIQVIYTSSDYDSATNDSQASIEAYIKIEANKFEIVSVRAIRNTNDDTKDLYPVGTKSNYQTYSGYFTAGTQDDGPQDDAPQDNT